MKGPGLRHDLDVRRVWRCPKCGRISRTPGQVTALRCGCSDPAQWMRLEPAVKKEPFRAPVREHLPEPWEVEESAAANPAPPTAAEPANEPATPASENTPQPTDQPAPSSTSAVVTETVAAEIIEIIAEIPAPAPATPPPDEFGTGVEEPPRNPHEP